MKHSSKWFSLVGLLFISLAVLSCKPEGERALDAKTGALASPIRTLPPASTSTPTLISPLPTPVPTPWPPAFTPSPMPTPSPTPEGVPYVIRDPVNRFSMTVLPGWYAYVPDAKAIGGITTIANYDMNRIDNRPPGGLSIHVGVSDLDPGQSFDQWLIERRKIETSLENGSLGVTLTEPQPYTLGRYTGVIYKAYDPSGEGSIVIYLLTSDDRILGVGLRPADAPAAQDGLSILSTIEISPKSSP